jgi:hypothetical protein
MDQEKDAFPTIRVEQFGDPAYNGPSKVHYSGMSLRDYFAGQALVGAAGHVWSSDEEMVRKCYEVAALMLKTRSSIRP